MLRRDLLLALLLSLLVACDGDSASNATATTPPPVTYPNGTRLLITIRRGDTNVIAGAQTTLDVAIARDGNDAFDGDVDLSLAPSDGFTAAPATLSRLATAAPLTISVAANHKHGVVPIHVLAKSRDQKAAGDLEVPVLVRGLPGTLDTSFGNAGIFTLGEASAEATGLIVQGDGKIVLGGRIGADAAIVRLDPSGHLDTTFGAGGKARIALAGVVSTNDVIFGASSSIILGGTASANSFLARVTSAGMPDAAFGSRGLVVTPTQSRSRALADGEGYIYVGGQSASASAADKNAMHVVRVLANGTFDPEWGGIGNAASITLPFASACPLGAGECFVTAMQAKPFGRLTVCASLGDGVNIRETFPSGTEDKNYDLTTPKNVFSRCTGLVNNTMFDLFAAGARDDDTFTLLHLLTSQTGGPLRVDPRFTPVSVPPESGIGGATRIAISGAGRVVASADAAPGGGPSQIALVRVDAFSTKVDTLFAGGKGYVTTPIGSTPAKSRALFVQSDGRIIVAGTNGDMVAVRYWH